MDDKRAQQGDQPTEWQRSLSDRIAAVRKKFIYLVAFQHALENRSCTADPTVEATVRSLRAATRCEDGGVAGARREAGLAGLVEDEEGVGVSVLGRDGGGGCFVWEAGACFVRECGIGHSSMATVSFETFSKM